MSYIAVGSGDRPRSVVEGNGIEPFAKRNPVSNSGTNRPPNSVRYKRSCRSVEMWSELTEILG